jgi:galactose mutarotase-like enzyme
MSSALDFPTRREWVLRSGNTLVAVIPAICLVSHFQVGSWEVLYRPRQTGNVRRWGLPLMIPNFSRLARGIFQEQGTSLPLHGFGRLFPWQVLAYETAQLTLQQESSQLTRKSYPYDFVFTVQIAVTAQTLTYTLTMQNRGAQAMPIAPGFHPYFSVAQAAKAALRVEGLAGFAATAWDWERQPPDTPYPFARQVTIHFPGAGTLTIAEVAQQEEYLLKNMQVWTEPPRRPDHAFVCFEPTVSSEDALNRPADRLLIAPGEARSIVLQLRAQEERPA